MKSRFLTATALWCTCLFIWTTNISDLGQEANPDSADTKLTSALDNLKLHLDQVMEENPIPGAAVAVVSGDSILLVWTSGHADLASGKPVTSQTHFTIGSCTKTFTGLAFLKLMDQGRIDLDTPVREIAPEITIDNPWESTDPVRIIHLLEHTAGFDDSRMNWFYFDGPVKSLQQAMQEKSQLRKVRWKPGTRFGYSSPGYTLAGYLLEKITGKSYEEFLRQEILLPLSMETSRIGDGEAQRALLATGYDRNIEPLPLWYDYDVPAGAMRSSIDEMARFVQFML
ncbi:MAG: beta-lactamase family protein, partial [Candidatus Zixiibacteriota bacterium]